MHSPSIDKSWGEDLAHMHLVSKSDKKNLDFHYKILTFIVYMGYSFKKITTTNAFQKILYESNHKPNKMWVDKGSEFTIDQ